MGQKWRERCLAAAAVIAAAGVSMLILWLLGSYLCYGNAKGRPAEEGKQQSPSGKMQEIRSAAEAEAAAGTEQRSVQRIEDNMEAAAENASLLSKSQEVCPDGQKEQADSRKEQTDGQKEQTDGRKEQTDSRKIQAAGQEKLQAAGEKLQADRQIIQTGEPGIQKLQADCEIRVQILGDSYQEACHPSVLVTSGEGLLVKRFLTDEVTDETKTYDAENNDIGAGNACDAKAENIKDIGAGNACEAKAENINDAGIGNACDAKAENINDAGIGNACEAKAENTDDAEIGNAADTEVEDTDAFLTGADPVGTSFEIAVSDLRIGEALCVAPQEADGRLTLPKLIRAENPPQYSGRLFLYRTGDGILVVNHLPLERYLPGVVASEMPSDYPLQAQMAQAVCARTYAYRHLLSARERGAVFDLDDSTACQVYNNYQAGAVSTAAVEATRGELLDRDEVLYYSTSCGINGRENLSKEQAFREFLAEEPEKDLKYGSPWVRWSARITKQELMRQAQELFAYAGTLDTVTVQSRRADGQVQELMLAGVGGSLRISGEYEIRRVLAPGADGVVLQNQQRVSLPGMLPSAWFWAEVSEDAVLLHGGGYGHGTGMSQCGAAAMAEAGADYREILRHYYGESE